MPTTTRFGAKNGKKNTVLAAARTLLWERPARIPSAEIDRNLLLTKWMTQTGTALDDLLAILQARDRTPQGLMDDLGLSGKMSESRRCKSMIGEQADREEVGAELANSFEHTHPEHFGSIGSPEQAGVRGRPGSSGDAGALRYSAVNKADMERRLKEAAAAQYAALGLPFPEDGRGLEQELREAAAAHHGALGLPFTEEDRDLEQNSREAVAAQDANDRSGPVVRASRQPTTTAYGEQSPAQAKHLQDRDVHQAPEECLHALKIPPLQRHFSADWQ